MKEKNIKIIENYIFAKTLNLIAKNTNVSRENMEIYNMINFALTQSSSLLLTCEEQIKKEKLNDISFLILKKELETANIYNNYDQNIKKIKEMLSKIRT